ncbi:hypothetical protein CW705_08910, partial [Candidatus Bathyarchaeota archaeon]
RVGMWGEGYPFDAPYVKRKVEYPRGLCPEAERFYKRTVGLPVLHHEASGELLDEYIEAVAKVLRNIESLK